MFRKKKHHPPKHLVLNEYLVIGIDHSKPVQLEIVAESAQAAEKETRIIYPGLVIIKVTLSDTG